MKTYRVTLTHPDLDGPFVADLIASSEVAAITRARMTAMHAYRHAPLMYAEAEAVYLHDGPPTDEEE